MGETDRLSKAMILILIIGLALTEVDYLLVWIAPSTDLIPVDGMYVSYHKPVTPRYYVYEFTDFVYKMARSFVLCIVARNWSYRFYLVCCIFLFFDMTQVLFYLINRNTDYFNNVIVYTIMAVMIFIWAKPFKKLAKIIKM
jgi:hypothetical protein